MPAEALEARKDQSSTSPQRKLVHFFEKSRDQWKAKCFDAKGTVTRLKNSVHFLARSKDHWKSRVKELETELARLHIREQDREAEIAILQKRLLNRRQREEGVWPHFSLRLSRIPLRLVT